MFRSIPIGCFSAGHLVGVSIMLTGCAGIDGVDFIYEDIDTDNDLIVDALDPVPDDRRFCGDADADGCDDCAIFGVATPARDGYDPDLDGECDVPVDFDCMNGSNAENDPFRAESCAMLSLVNADRIYFAEESGDAAPLRWSEEIWAVAHAHAVDMCERDFFDHVNPDGLDPSGRAVVGGLAYQLAENISANYDPRSAEYAFMAEPTCIGHRGNILDRRHAEVGIGYHVCPTNSSGYHFSVQNFRRDSSLSGAPYCQSASTACEVPDDPPSTATCPSDLASLCEPPSLSWLARWGCPAD